MADKRGYEIVYDSDFIIDDPVELSTLCVFYDKVYLPFRNVKEVGAVIGELFNADQDSIVLSPIWIPEVTWEIENKLFFDEGIIARLEIPSVKRDALIKVGDIIQNAKRGGPVPNLLKRALANDNEYSMDEAVANGFMVQWYMVALHLGRSDISLPRLLTDNPNFVNRETFKTLLADRAFRYVLPTLSELQPEQVLELRRKVADVREGFSMHLQKLTCGIDARLKGSETFEDIIHYAHAVFETELEPDYLEFKKLLGAEKVSGGASVLDLAGRVCKFFVGPWDTQSFSALLEAMGLGADLMAKQSKDLLTNQSQAFQFMHRVENSEINRK